jgi:hypothetical protein
VVPPDKCYPVWVSYFKAKKEKKRLEGVKASINKIACAQSVRVILFRTSGESLTHKQIICIRHVTAHSKQLHEVMELSMYIAAYLHSGGD